MAIITISRGTFSGGKAVAEKLAEKLDYPCLSREILIKKAAQHFQLEEHQLNDAMEEVPGILDGDASVSAANVNFVRAVLLNEIRSQELVYHGYAGDLLLKGVKKILRIRVIASIDYRIEAAMRDHQIGSNEARKMIEQLDRKRNKWSEIVLGTEWSDPSLYDVALSLDSISLDSAVDTIKQLTELDEFTVDDTTSRSLEDLLISSNIWAALSRNNHTRSVQLEIVTINGHVSLYGDVNSRKTAEMIVYTAEQEKGVEDVTSKLNVGMSWLW